MQKFSLSPSLSQACGAGMGWGDPTQCLVCRHALHPFPRTLPMHRAHRLFLESQKAVTRHTADTHTAHFERLSAFFFVSCLDLRQEGNKPIPKFLHVCTLWVGIEKRLQEQRCVLYPHLLQQAAAPKPRTPAGIYIGNLKSIAGKKPK